jgi:hypothetical protein
MRTTRMIKLNTNNTLYIIRAKNYFHIMFLIFSILYFLYIGMDFYDGIVKNGMVINLKNTNYFNLIMLLVNIIVIFVLFISSLILLFMKSCINDEYIILSDGIFKISMINKVEKIKNNKIKIYLKKNSPFALLGYKIFIVKKNEHDDIYSFINNNIRV